MIQKIRKVSESPVVCLGRLKLHYAELIHSRYSVLSEAVRRNLKLFVAHRSMSQIVSEIEMSSRHSDGGCGLEYQ